LALWIVRWITGGVEHGGIDPLYAESCDRGIGTDSGADEYGSGPSTRAAVRSLPPEHHRDQVSGEPPYPPQHAPSLPQPKTGNSKGLTVHRRARKMWVTT
jgi:hypothetical protein